MARRGFIGTVSRIAREIDRANKRAAKEAERQRSQRERSAVAHYRASEREEAQRQQERDRERKEREKRIATKEREQGRKRKEEEKVMAAKLRTEQREFFARIKENEERSAADRKLQRAEARRRMVKRVLR